MKPEKIETFPASPGVYLMRDAEGQILYVGKAKNLRTRVRAYLHPSRDSRYQIRFLMERVADIEYIVTDTEKEALILENTLIKKHRPRYNINLRDDKTYFSLRMDPSEEFPRLTIIRKVTRDGARYFGPYSSASAARDVLKQLYRLFPLRHYPLETCRRRKRPCLFHQLRQCSAPCQGLISREEYANLAEGAALFLEGKNRDLIKSLTSKMNEAAKKEKFEEAARLRDLVRAISVTVEKQKMVTDKGDFDVLGYFRNGQNLEVVLLFVRGGSLIGSRNFTFSWEMDDAEGISSFLNEYYNRDEYIPTGILLPIAVNEPEALEELLSEKRGRKVSITVPRRGTKAELVQLAAKNAETAVREKAERADAAETILAELRQRLHLTNLPRRIECYDISTLQGKHAVGSRVVFLDGAPHKEDYRRYRIKTISQADDYGMMHEVLSRRFADMEKGGAIPDLILVDGGPGQLNVLVRVLEDLGIPGADTASLAKSRVERESRGADIRRSDERVFLPGRKNPVVLRQNSQPLLLLAGVRDEAHRFAITYHKKLRSKEAIAPAVGSIPGIGDKRWKKLLRHFGSLKELQKATVDELTAVPGISEKTAKAIREHLKQA
ncbi:MAG TPA: excinuclease ABC subunit UvrC [Geobacteraceae bacterium]|nr:excinuclease ABC subunit UvrC [Geobacteraceae bacterium]